MWPAIAASGSPWPCQFEKLPYEFDKFPPVFEGLLPEGMPLEAMLRQNKIDKKDLFKQLVTVGEDVVGSLTIKEVP